MFGRYMLILYVVLVSIFGKEQVVGKKRQRKASSKTAFRKDDYEMFMIAGTQKSGTTVLSGLLADHPEIAFSKKKELHYYDKSANYEKGLSSYLKNFTPNPEVTRYIGEATPYYIASREACNRIAKDFPKVRMIVLLREPVKRAYSEYQMKVRRVDNQAAFFSIVQQHSEHLYHCFINEDINQISSSQCIPAKVRKHPLFKKLTTAIKRSVSKRKLTIADILDRCFPREDPSQSSSTLAVKSSMEGSFPLLRQSCTVEACPLDMCSKETSPKPVDNGGSIDMCLGDKKNIFKGGSTSSGTQPNHRSYVHRNNSTSAHSRRGFNASACWTDYSSGYERIQPLHQALVGEADAFTACAGDGLDLNFRSEQHLSTLKDDIDDEYLETYNVDHYGSGNSEYEYDDNVLAWTLETLADVDEAIRRCIRVKGGISSQYIYRSLYAPQLFHCYSSLSPAQFLILPSERLRTSPAAVLREVLEFLGLVPVDEDWVQRVVSQMDQTVQTKFAG